MAADPHALSTVPSQDLLNLYELLLYHLKDKATLSLSVKQIEWNDILLDKTFIEYCSSIEKISSPESKKLTEKTCQLIYHIFSLRWQNSLDLMRQFKPSDKIGNSLLIMGLEMLGDLNSRYLNQWPIEYPKRLSKDLISRDKHLQAFLIEFQNITELLKLETLTNQKTKFFQNMLSASLEEGVWDLYSFLKTQLQIPLSLNLRNSYMEPPNFSHSPSLKAFIDLFSTIKMNLSIARKIPIEEFRQLLGLPNANPPPFFLYMQELQKRILLSHLWESCQVSQLEDFSFDLGGIYPSLVQASLKTAINAFNNNEKERKFLSESIEANTKLNQDYIIEILEMAKNDILETQKNVDTKTAQDSRQDINFMIKKIEHQNFSLDLHIVSLGFYKQYCLFINRAGSSEKGPPIFPHGPGISLYDCGSPEKVQVLMKTLADIKNMTDFMSTLEKNAKFARQFPMKEQQVANCGIIAAKGLYFFSVYFRTLEKLKSNDAHNLIAEKTAAIALKHFSHFWKVSSLIKYINEEGKIEQDKPLLWEIYFKTLFIKNSVWQASRTEPVLLTFSRQNIVVPQEIYLKRMQHYIYSYDVEKIKIIAPRLTKETLKQNAAVLLDSVNCHIQLDIRKKEKIESQIGILKILFDLGLSPNEVIKTGGIPNSSFLVNVMNDFIRVRTDEKAASEREIYLRLLKISKDALLANNEKPEQDPYTFYTEMLDKRYLQPNKEADDLIRAIFPPMDIAVSPPIEMAVPRKPCPCAIL